MGDRTAQLTVEVPNMEKALAQARQIATRGGGYVSVSNTHIETVNDQDRMVADLTIQVRSDTADQTRRDLRALGKVTTENSGSQDVTEEYVDLGANLRNLQASEQPNLKLIDKATQIQDVTAARADQRSRSDRAHPGSKTYLERRSTWRPSPCRCDGCRDPTATGVNGAWEPLGIAQRGWQASLNVLRATAEVVIVVAAFSWWLLPLAGLGAYLWLHRRRPAAPVAPATPATPAGA